MTDCDHLVRKPDLDVEVVQSPVAPVSGRRGDDDPAVRDAGVEFLQAPDQDADTALERRRVVEVAEGNLQRHRRGGGVGAACGR